MEKSYISLDYEGIKNNFPRALTAVEGWFLANNDIAKGLKVMGVDMSHTSAMSKLVMSVIMFDPRKLYDVFDSLGCKIYITHHPEVAEAFCYYNSVEKTSKVAPARRNAEVAAFLEAFEVLEKTLADGENKERVQTPD